QSEQPQPTVLNFEKPSLHSYPAFSVTTGISAPDTVIYQHTETIREIMSAQVLSDWFEENMEIFQGHDPKDDQLIKLITDYQKTLDDNRELMSKYLDATKEKNEVKQAVQTQEKVMVETPTIMFILLLIGQFLQSLKYRYSRKKEEKLIEELRNSRCEHK